MKKYRNFKKLLIVFIIGAFTLTNCNDWLDVAPTDELVKEQFWLKTEDVYSALASTYNAMRRAGLQSLILGECRADLVVFSGASFSNYAQIAASNISPTNSAVNWEQYYSAINLANTLMYFNKQVFELDGTFTREMLDGVDAEALFIRSLAYFYLVRLWKDVPLVLEPSISDTSDIYVPKSTERVVIDQIISDLQRAKDMAYTTQYLGTDLFYGRANRYSIMALLADVYLWDEQYTKVIEYCDYIINSGLFSLEESDTWFNIYYPGNSRREGIFEFQFNTRLDDQSNPIYNNMIRTDGNPEVGLNTRMTSLLLHRDDARNIGGQGAIWKYRGKDDQGLIQRTFTERDANWIIYRYADVLLMKAEALIELDRFSEANELIWETMIRAGIPTEEQFEKNALRRALLDERGREFLLEGKRWFDILRAGKRDNFQNRQIIIDMILSGADVKQQAVLRTSVFDTLSYYLPIYERELLFNQNLVQNPFYDR